MKKVKLPIKILATIMLVCCWLCCLVGCTGSSVEKSIPEQYTGTYGSGQYGNIEVTADKIYTKELLLPQCVVGGKEFTDIVVCWDPTAFTYNSSKEFSFSPYVKGVTTSTCGQANFSGKLVENVYTYDIWFKYYAEKCILFAKSK